MAVLSYRQQREIEIYAQLAPIGPDGSVSMPPEDEPEPSEEDGAHMFEQIKGILGG